MRGIGRLKKILTTAGKCLRKDESVFPGRSGISSRLTRRGMRLGQQKHRHFDLLRQQYVEYTRHSAAEKGPTASKPLEYLNVNIIPGSRISVRWGDGNEQIVGKRPNHCPLEPGFLSPPINQPLNTARTFYIVTPSYNASAYIDSTISSIVSQEGSFELYYHVQDGGSTDDTAIKLEKWLQILSDPECPLNRSNKLHFSYTCEKDDGMYDAINKGFEHLKPTPEAICSWINADDVLVGGALATVDKIFRTNQDASWLIGSVNGCARHQEELSQINIQYPRDIIAEGLCEHKNWRFIQQEGTFWTGRLWSNVGGVNTKLKLCGDWDLWRRFAIRATPIQVMWPLGRFRIHGDQLTSHSMSKYYEELSSIVPEDYRKKRLAEILSSAPEPTRLVFRPNKTEASYKYELMPLQERFALPTRHNSCDLQKHFRFSDSPRVLTLCTIAYGGAGTGSVRRVEALRDIGVDAKLLSLITESRQEYIGKAIPALDMIDTTIKSVAWKSISSNIRHKITDQPFYKGHDFFSLTDSMLEFRQLKPLIDEYDVVHLHWVVGMIDYNGMRQALADKPVVWTTADMTSFTGGCHYSEGCTGFMSDCSDCPMISGSSKIPHEAWKTKKAAYEGLDITLVCPSEYIANLARQSSLMRDKSIIVIPNAYPVDKFIPIERNVALRRFKLKRNKKYILFGAESLENPRKGGDLLRTVAKYLASGHEKRDIEFLCIGNGKVELPVKVHHLGKLDQKAMCYAYSAADVHVSLSREDVGPMTVVESLLCGTPVVGFSIGVLPEVVIQHHTGMAVEPYNVDEIVNGIEYFLSDGLDVAQTAELCRQTAVRYGDPVASANRHKKLYESLIQKHISMENGTQK